MDEKLDYVAPAVEVVDFEITEILAGSVGGDVSTPGLEDSYDNKPARVGRKSFWDNAPD